MLGSGVGLHPKFARRQFFNLDAQSAQQFEQPPYVYDVGYVFDRNDFGRQQWRAENLEGFVFGTLRFDGAGERYAAVDAEGILLHGVGGLR